MPSTRYLRSWRARHREQDRASKRRWYWKNVSRCRAQETRYRRKLRASVLAHYGGKCACCGESRDEFLSIDHINGGGDKHRRETKGHVFAWLKRNGFPAGFRVLCHNCNMARGFFGYCPHEREKAYAA